MRDWILGKLAKGRTIELDQLEITPVARSWVLPLPGATGGLVYNRPEAVVVRAGGSKEQRLAVPDQTRRYQLLIWTAAAALVVIIRLLTSSIVKRNRRK